MTVPILVLVLEPILPVKPGMDLQKFGRQQNLDNTKSLHSHSSSENTRF